MEKLHWTCRNLQHEDFEKKVAQEYTIEPTIISLNEDTSTSEEGEEDETEENASSDDN